MSRFFWVIGILLLVGTLVGAWYLNHNGAFQGQPRASADDPLPAKIMCHGFVDNELGVIKMYPVRSGEVVFVIAEGKEVKKDTVLLKLDDTQAKIKVDLAQVELNVALQLETKAKLRPQQHEFQIKQLQAKIDAAKSSLKAAQERLDRDRKRAETTGDKLNLKQYEEELKSKQEEIKVPEAALEELKVYDPQLDIDTASENVAGKRLQLKEAQFGLSKCELKASEDGLVLQVSINAGEVIGPNPTHPVLLFAPNVPRIVKAEVIQEWASHVEVGQEALIEDDTYRGPTWKGKVKQIAGFYSHKTPIREPFMMIDQRILQCTVEIEPGQSPPLRIGQRVRVSITPTQK